MKKYLNNLLGKMGYKVTKRKNFLKLFRTLDETIISLINKQNPIIFDVGAHNGETIQRFNKVFKSPIFHCFEPQKDCFENLKKFDSKNVFLNNFALGEKKEIKEINILNESASSSLYNLDENSTFLNNLKKVDTQKISISTIDDYVMENSIKTIDLLKIDVQGYEDQVLKGALKSLEKFFLIEVEIIFVDYYEKKKSFYDIEKTFLNNNFELYSISTPQFTKNYRVKWLDALYVNTNLLSNYL